MNWLASSCGTLGQLELLLGYYDAGCLAGQVGKARWEAGGWAWLMWCWVEVGSATRYVLPYLAQGLAWGYWLLLLGWLLRGVGGFARPVAWLP